MTETAPSESDAQSEPATPAARGIEPFLQQCQDLLTLFAQSMTGSAIPAASVAKFLDWSAQYDPQSMPALAAKWGFSPGLYALGGKLLPSTPEQDVLLSALRRVFAGAWDACQCGDALRFTDAIKEYETAQQAMRDINAQLSQRMQHVLREAQARFAEEIKATQAADGAFKDVFQLANAWQASLGPVTHDELQSEQCAALFATAMQSQSRLRVAHNRIVELVSEALNVPTRAEVDEAYRLIHQLRREVRSLHKRIEETLQ